MRVQGRKGRSCLHGERTRPLRRSHVERQASSATGCGYHLRGPRAVWLQENRGSTSEAVSSVSPSMSPLSKKDYPQDKQPSGPPPAYPNQAYHPPSQRHHTAVKICSHHSYPDPPHKPAQYHTQPQPQPQVVYVERREDRGNDAGLCATAWSVFVIPRYSPSKRQLTTSQLPRSLRELLLPLLVLLLKCIPS